MEVESPYKVCPTCLENNALNAAACASCGHLFTTQFTAPPQTQAFYPPQQAPYHQPAQVGTHSKVAAGLMGILIGWLGIHGFYMGNTTMGIVFLVVSIVGGFFTCGVATSIMGLIGLIQGILYLVATDADFHQKYVVEKRWF